MRIEQRNQARMCGEHGGFRGGAIRAAAGRGAEPCERATVFVVAHMHGLVGVARARTAIRRQRARIARRDPGQAGDDDRPGRGREQASATEGGDGEVGRQNAPACRRMHDDDERLSVGRRPLGRLQRASMHRAGPPSPEGARTVAIRQERVR
ncbi:hypothetical protein [Burkholderia metallica]|uniref:hypothetical protein n=1 Tax=Burkholderia metallica TaxID=488729 RepID=UPI0015899330